jgi:hypothetical protein
MYYLVRLATKFKALNSMEEFTIISRITTKEYVKVMLLGLYKKPIFIIASLFGIYYLSGLSNEWFTPMSYNNEVYFIFFIGLFLLLSPLIITMIAAKQFYSNPSFRTDIKYTFGKNGMIVEGVTFKGEFAWTHIIKQKEISNFLILYHTNKMGNFIDKTKLTLDQLNFIKSKVNKKKSATNSGFEV